MSWRGELRNLILRQADPHRVARIPSICPCVEHCDAEQRKRTKQSRITGIIFEDASPHLKNVSHPGAHAPRGYHVSGRSASSIAIAARRCNWGRSMKSEALPDELAERIAGLNQETGRV